MDARELLLLQPGGSRAYPMSTWRRMFLFLLAALLLGVGFILLVQPATGRQRSDVTAGVLELVLILVGLWLALLAIQKRVQVEADLAGRIVVRLSGIFTSKSIAADEIRGRRTFRSRYGSYLVLETAGTERRKLRIPNSFAFDDAWQSWLGSVPDLDLLDREEILIAIAQSAELGGTPEERLLKLRSAKRITIVLSGIAIAAGLSLWLLSSSLDRRTFGLLDVLLATLPWIALGLTVRSPLLYTMAPSKSDPRAPLFVLLMACGPSLLASPFANLQTGNSTMWVGFGLIPGLILFFGFLKPSRSGSITIRPIVAVLIFCGIYGFGLVKQINTQLDGSKSSEATAQVLKKTESRGRSTAYYLHLSPWQSLGGESRISVSATLYNTLEEGDTVCIAAHSGALGMGWYTVNTCR